MYPVLQGGQGILSGLRVKAKMSLVLAAAETAPGKIKDGAGWDEYIRET